MAYYDIMIDSGFYPLHDCVEAGYFKDGYTSDAEIKSMLFGSVYDTPIINKYKSIMPDVVVAMSGCFSPIHEGHLNALKTAKEYYESKGQVVMGIIIPANDSYVDVKRDGSCKCSAIERILTIKQCIEDNGMDWLVVDEHPALAMPYELNFPHLIERIEYLTIDTKISFVVGSDNQNFAIAMVQGNHDTFVIKRKDDVVDIIDRLSLLGERTDTTIVVEENAYQYLSSSVVRSNIRKPTENGVYVVRNDLQLVGVANYDFVAAVFVEYVKTNCYENVLVIDVKDQLNLTYGYVSIKYPRHVVISMDKYFKGDFNIDCSREFEEYTCQTRSKSYLIRNKGELVQYLKGLPDDVQVLIVDDDISSGYSINIIDSIVKEYAECNNIEHLFMNELYMSVYGITEKQIDIVDMRDFVYGAVNGGLVVEGGKRVPYTYPYVNINKRAKIPYEKVLEFSRFIKVLNQTVLWNR